MFEKVYRNLKNKGFDVYSIGQHQGKCTDPFIVIKEHEPMEKVGSGYNNNLLKLICYYPFGKYSNVKPFRESIELVMDELKEFDREFVSNPVMIDNEKNAYFFTLQYNNKKLRRF